MKEDGRLLGEASSLMSPEKRRQIAQWIRDGLDTPNVHENRGDFFTMYYERCVICALGAAVLGKHGGNVEKMRKSMNRARIILTPLSLQDLLGFPIT